MFKPKGCGFDTLFYEAIKFPVRKKKHTYKPTLQQWLGATCLELKSLEGRKTRRPRPTDFMHLYNDRKQEIQ